MGLRLLTPTDFQQSKNCRQREQTKLPRFPQCYPARLFHRQNLHFRLTALGLMSADLASFYSKTRDARKVIVVDLGFLGDTVHLLPALRELKRSYSRAELHVLTSVVGCEVLGLASWVDRAWPIEMSRHKRSLRQQWQVLRDLRRERFDVAFNFSGADRTIFMTTLTDARWRVAYHERRSHFWNRWLVPIWIPFIQPTDRVFERRREMLKLCGFQLAPAGFDLQVPDSACDWASSQVPEEAIHLSINASTHLKEWPLENWIELGKRLCKESHIRILATGSENPRERSRLEDFASALKGSKVQVFWGVSIAHLAALLSRCVLHVGADSGVLHLAMALGLPTISLFRNYPAMREWLPRGPQHRSFTANCACIGQKHAPCLKQPIAVCLKENQPAAVAQAVNEILAARAHLSNSKS
jgi:ADP-heptose:LPS heptosyltransferase